MQLQIKHFSFSNAQPGFVCEATLPCSPPIFPNFPKVRVLEFPSFPVMTNPGALDMVKKTGNEDNQLYFSKP
nr:MAG: hypothetical protein EDM05_20085 [Leptolyngbya sp. IPPAS B-1204]